MENVQLYLGEHGLGRNPVRLVRLVSREVL